MLDYKTFKEAIKTLMVLSMASLFLISCGRMKARDSENFMNYDLKGKDTALGPNGELLMKVGKNLVLVTSLNKECQEIKKKDKDKEKVSVLKLECMSDTFKLRGISGEKSSYYLQMQIEKDKKTGRTFTVNRHPKSGESKMLYSLEGISEGLEIQDFAQAILEFQSCVSEDYENDEADKLILEMKEKSSLDGLNKNAGKQVDICSGNLVEEEPPAPVIEPVPTAEGEGVAGTGIQGGQAGPQSPTPPVAEPSPAPSGPQSPTPPAVAEPSPAPSGLQSPTPPVAEPSPALSGPQSPTPLVAAEPSPALSGPQSSTQPVAAEPSPALSGPQSPTPLVAAEPSPAPSGPQSPTPPVAEAPNPPVANAPNPPVTKVPEVVVADADKGVSSLVLAVPLEKKLGKISLLSNASKECFDNRVQESLGEKNMFQIIDCFTETFLIKIVDPQDGENSLFTPKNDTIEITSSADDGGNKQLIVRNISPKGNGSGGVSTPQVLFQGNIPKSFILRKFSKYLAAYIFANAWKCSSFLSDDESATHSPLTFVNELLSKYFFTRAIFGEFSHIDFNKSIELVCSPVNYKKLSEYVEDDLANGIIRYDELFINEDFSGRVLQQENEAAEDPRGGSVDESAAGAGNSGSETLNPLNIQLDDFDLSIGAGIEEGAALLGGSSTEDSLSNINTSSDPTSQPQHEVVGLNENVIGATTSDLGTNGRLFTNTGSREFSLTLGAERDSQTNNVGDRGDSSATQERGTEPEQEIEPAAVPAAAPAQ